MTDEIRLRVAPQYKAHAGLIQPTLEQLVETAGWRIAQTDQSSFPELVYGGAEHNLPWIAIPSENWTLLETSDTTKHAGLSVPSCAVTNNQLDWTVVAANALAGYPERRPGVEQHFGVPGAAIEDWNLVSEPVVERASRQLRDWLEQSNRYPPPRPRWPSGRTWAVCLTHDVDRVRKHRTASFLRDARRSLAGRRFRAAAGQSFFAIESLLRRSRFREDPYAKSWRRWIEFESQRQTGGTYFVATWSREDPESDLRDVHYRARSSDFRDAIQRLRDKGLEIGLHNSIHSWSSNRFDIECERFAEYFGCEPLGYRGHYWSLDPQSPVATMRAAQLATSLEYSSCFGMNEVTGFRRGLAYPWRPFDPKTGQYCGSWEIPPIMMDYSLLRCGTGREDWAKELRKRTAQIRHWQGCLVLDWHTDTLERDDYGPVTETLLGEIDLLREDSTCWMTCLSDVYQWCRRERWCD